MTPDIAAEALPLPENQTRSTAGMTTKVVKGSIWTLAGQVAPMMVAFVATPFTIRFLGSEGYGVLILVGLIPMYFGFADFGMGVASTKFASEAYGQGDLTKEREFIWTATAIAAVTAMTVAVPIFLFSYQIVSALNVPEHLLRDASIALKITSASFFLGILASVLNTPMLARLRMDMNAFTNAVPKLLLASVTPFVLYYGGGIVGAVWWALIIGSFGFAFVFYFSTRLLPGLIKPTFNSEHLRPLLKFGAGWFVAMVAAMLLVNLEKIFLTKMVSVKALAFYSVAFTFASMATMFSQAMIQTLVPAFSQLMVPEKRAEFDALFARSIRLNIIWLLPALMIMFVVAEPFFTLWAGEEFGSESTVPFYILLFGLFFNILAYVPHASITASGRTDIFAKLYWFELAFYAVLAWMLIGYFGIVGAAAAWSIRVILDAVIIIVLSKKIAHTKFRFFSHFGVLLLAAGVLAIPIALTIASSRVFVVITVAAVSVSIYGVIIWRRYVDGDEKAWISNRFNGLLSF